MKMVDTHQKSYLHRIVKPSSSLLKSSLQESNQKGRTHGGELRSGGRSRWTGQLTGARETPRALYAGGAIQSSPPRGNERRPEFYREGLQGPGMLKQPGQSPARQLMASFLDMQAPAPSPYDATRQQCKFVHNMGASCGLDPFGPSLPTSEPWRSFVIEGVPGSG